MKTTTTSIASGMTTGIVAFTMFSEAIAGLLHRPETVGGLTQMSHPVFLVMVTAFWKLLGRLTGAAVSYLVSHHAVWHVVVMLVRQIVNFALTVS